ncbi:endonuclease IV [Candidatus Pacearchaeota archaeon CG10_big_fil_rev_8_21_14_0_10_32_42]|nr:MAG: endonuclease IV [Candidatus Pacearchaeota archaeon CG10_big_fil_rev_8_21_14_0_10_32_42]
MYKMENIKFGPAGIGSVKDAIKNLEEYHKLGLRACEIAFTYSVYIKEKYAIEIGKVAKKLGIQLSIHAPYFINLNSEDEEKIENSKKRILKCLEIGTFLGAEYVVIHSGFYGKKSKEETYTVIKKNILELEKIRKEKGYTPKIAPETMGKINVFGSIEEIAQLVRDTGCSACIDFAHILARSGGEYRFVETLKIFKTLPDLHIHFSGIVYGDKGEKHHKKTSEEEWKKLIINLPKNKKIIIINESPNMLGDSVKGLEILKGL